MIGPLLALLHGEASLPVRARISVPVTLSTWASAPPMKTETGSLNPVPSILTSVPPSAEPRSGATVVICIFGMYRNPPDDVTDLPELPLSTLTSTGPVTVPVAFGFVSRAVGDMTMI